MKYNQPNSPILALELSIKHWTFNGRILKKGKHKLKECARDWNERVRYKWSKHKIILKTWTSKRQTTMVWKASQATKWNLMLWRVLH